jgi:hypothetical protein
MRYTIKPQLENETAQGESMANTSVGYGKKNTIQATVRRSRGNSQARRAHLLDGASRKRRFPFLGFITFFFSLLFTSGLYGILKVGQRLSSFLFLTVAFCVHWVAL